MNCGQITAVERAGTCLGTHTRFGFELLWQANQSAPDEWWESMCRWGNRLQKSLSSKSSPVMTSRFSVWPLTGSFNEH